MEIGCFAQTWSVLDQIRCGFDESWGGFDRSRVASTKLGVFSRPSSARIRPTLAWFRPSCGAFSRQIWAGLTDIKVLSTTCGVVSTRLGLASSAFRFVPSLGRLRCVRRFNCGVVQPTCDVVQLQGGGRGKDVQDPAKISGTGPKDHAQGGHRCEVGPRGIWRKAVPDCMAQLDRSRHGTIRPDFDQH